MSIRKSWDLWVGGRKGYDGNMAIKGTRDVFLSDPPFIDRHVRSKQFSLNLNDEWDIFLVQLKLDYFKYIFILQKKIKTFAELSIFLKDTEKWRLFPHCRSDRGLKGTVVNRKWPSLNGMSFEIIHIQYFTFIACKRAAGSIFHWSVRMNANTIQ